MDIYCDLLFLSNLDFQMNESTKNQSSFTLSKEYASIRWYILVKNNQNPQTWDILMNL